MFFKDLFKKISLIEQASQSENELDKLEKKLKILYNEQELLKNKILQQKNKVEDLMLSLNKHKEKNEEIELLIEDHEKNVSDKRLALESLIKKWNELDETEKKLRKYFGDLL